MTFSNECSTDLPENFPDDSRIKALSVLLDELAASGYRFITPTPVTHRTVLMNRRGAPAQTLRDIFGWNLSFDTTCIEPRVLELMQAGGILAPRDDLQRSTIRIASLDDCLFYHSGYPTMRDDAVFFGPDTYRFLRFIRQTLQQMAPRPPMRRILDIGCGSGVGAILSARMLATLKLASAGELEVVTNDINPLALALTGINARAAGVTATPALGDAFSVVSGKFDLIVCNPPYLDDGQERAYRHGGAGLGRELGVRIAEEGVSRLAPGGSLLLYTGVAILDGRDEFIAALEPGLTAGRYEWHYEEIDPDIFGEELTTSQYESAERIAAVGLTVKRPDDTMA